MNCAQSGVQRAIAALALLGIRSQQGGPREPAAPTEHRTQAGHRRDKHASTQKTADEGPGQSPHGPRAEAPREPGVTVYCNSTLLIKTVKVVVQIFVNFINFVNHKT